MSSRSMVHRSALEKHENGASQDSRALLHDIIKSVRVREQIKVLEG